MKKPDPEKVDEAIRLVVEEGYNLTAAGKKVGLSDHVVRSSMRKRGIPLPGKRTPSGLLLTSEYLEEMNAKYGEAERIRVEEGITIVDAARRAGVSESGFRGWRRSRHMPHAPRTNKPARSRLLEETLRLLSDGEPRRSAEVFREVSRFITPAQALRQVEYERAWSSKKRHGAEEAASRVKQEDTDFLVQSGKWRVFRKYITNSAGSKVTSLRLLKDSDTGEEWLQSTIASKRKEVKQDDSHEESEPAEAPTGSHDPGRRAGDHRDHGGEREGSDIRVQGSEADRVRHTNR